MKKLYFIWLALTSLLASAQVSIPYVSVKTTVGGSTVFKVAPRDPSIYPATPSGDAGFLTAVNSGVILPKVVPADGSIVGRYSYNFTDARHDYLNRNVVSDPAPVLVDGARTVPRLLGNYYPMAPQLALNTALYGRFPTFALHSSKIVIYPGGLYNGSGDNNLVGHGWTHTSESAHWIDGGTYPTTFRRALEMANYQAAYTAAQSLPDSDPRKAKLLAWAGPLPAFEGTHTFIDDEATCQLYAQFFYNTFKQTDWFGAGVDYFSVNHEIYTPRDNGIPYTQQWYNQVGWITKEIIRLASVEGVTLKSGMSDWGNLTHPSPYFFDDNDPATGFPRYMSVGYVVEPYRGASQSAPMGANTDLGALVQSGKAFVGVGSYVQHTFDEQSLFEKYPSGAYKIGSDGGLVWRTDVRNTTITGQNTVLYNEDAYKSQLKFYGIFARYCTNQFFRAGSVHLPRSDVRQSGFSAVRLLRQFRLETEVESGLTPTATGTTQDQFNQLNSRPLNPDWTEADAIGMYLFSDYLRGWSDTNAKTDLGADNGKPIKSRASVEMYSKGFHRASQLNWIFDTPWTLIQPKLWIKNQGMVSTASPDEQLYRKPIILGGLATKNGKPTIWLYWWWPCQDVDRYTDVTVWATGQSGNLTPGYHIRIKGRKAGLESWTLPDAAAGIAPTNLRFQFASLLGEKITWTGDYRDAKITANPTPPAIQEAELSGGTSSTATTPSSTTSGTPSWIAGLRYSYAAPLLSVEALGQIGGLKFERLDNVSFSTTNPDNVPINSGAFYSFGTPPSGDAPYTERWQINYSGPALRLTLQQASSSSVYSYTLTPTDGASNVVLTAPTTSTVSSGTSTGGGSTTTSTTYSAFSQSLSYSNSVTSDFLSQDGGHHTNQFITSADYADYSITGAPVSDGAYTLAFTYQTNYDCSGCGQGSYVLNGGTPVNFPMDGAAGGSRTPTFTIALNAGTNTIRIQGNSQTFFQTGILVTHAGGTSTSTTSTSSSPGTTSTPVVSATGLAAMGLNPNFTAPADQGWNVVTTREKYIENSTLKIGFLRGGAAISYAALKANNRNLVNSNQVYYNDDPSDFRYNTVTDDVGRQIMFFSDYFSPGPNDNGGQGLILKNGKKTGTGYKGTVFNTGYNVVQGGSMQPAVDLSPILSSAVYTHSTRGIEFYAKMRPQIWGLKGETGWETGEEWISFATPNTIHCFIRHTIEARDQARVDEQRTFGAQAQENPCLYVIAPLTQKLIDLPGAPRTNIYSGIGFSPTYFTTTCKIGAYEGDGGTGVTAYSPKNSLARSLQVLSTQGDWSTNASSYISMATDRNYDNPGVYEDELFITFGTEADANAAIATLPGIDQSFDFDFTKENMQWPNYNSRLIKESAGWTLYLDPHTDNGQTNYLAKLMSPARAWQASSLTTLNFEVAVTNATSLYLEWQKPGLSQANQFHKEFTVNPDGQFHTISVSTSDPNFNGIISSLGFSAGSGTSANARVVIRHIYKS